MSNTQLGQVYLRIMEDVVDNCHTTFEEEGVNPGTLEDLKKTWQTKLSALKVGTFPWEPPPAPQPMVNPATLPSNVPRPGSLPNGQPPSLPSSNEVRVKQEPGTEQTPKIPQLPPNFVDNDAKERAMANLHQKFGANANSQITQIQSSMLPRGQGLPSVGPGRPDLTPEQREAHAEYQRRQHANMMQQYQQRQQAAAAGGPNSQQSDGTTENWDKYVAERRAHATETAQEADRSIRQQVEQSHRANEGGGLMMPLAEQSNLPQAKRRRIDTENGADALPQNDGADEDDEDVDKKAVKDELFGDDDEDAINSDLDDPEENEIEEEADDGKPTQVMLCTYDKVQRVKNKWKCTLRDGVLNSGGKEYVFGKANGEFEW